MSYEKMTSKDVEEEVGEVLKYAPHRRGGAKDKVTQF